MPTWVAVYLCVNAFMPLVSDPPASARGAMALAALCLAAASNFLACVLADHDAARHAPLRAMYLADWAALALAASGGLLLLVPTLSPHEAYSAVAAAILAIALFVIDAVRWEISRRQPPPLDFRHVFD